MDLLLSSPIPIVAIFFLIIIVGVFLFELRKTRGQKNKPPPLPPTSIRIPKKEEPQMNRKKILIGGSLIVAVLVIALPVLFILIHQRQITLKQAEEPLSPNTTPTNTPKPMPTATKIPTPSPTTAQNLPTCLKLAAAPTIGRAPLNVTFEAKGENSTGEITAFEFDFGNNSKQLIQKTYTKNQTAIESVDRVYNEPGTYKVSVRVRDENNNWSAPTQSCQTSIEVQTSEGKTATSFSEDAIGGPETTTTPTTTLKPTASAQEGSVTLTQSPETATSSASPTSSTKESVSPETPEAGFALPTVLLSIGGLAFIVLSFVLLV